MHWRQTLHAITVRLRPNGRSLLRVGAVLYRERRRAFGRAVQNRMPERVPIALKLALVFTVLIASGMVLLGVLVGTNQARLLEQQIADFGNTLANQAAESVKEPLLAGDVLTLELTTNSLIGNETVLGVGIYSDDGERLTHTGIVPPTVHIEDTGLGRLADDETRLDWAAERWGEALTLSAFVAPVRFRNVTAGYVLLTFERSLLEQAKHDTAKAVTATTALMLVIGIAFSFYLAGRLTRPIHRLMDASRAISEGKYDIRFTDRRNDELGVLMQAMNDMGEGLLRKEQVEKVFSRYVSPNVARQVLSELENVEQVELGGRHVEATVLFADIVGFTSMSEDMTPEAVSQLLNDYFTEIARAVHFCGGHIDKYMGDCAMIVFGVPEPYPDHAFRATACARMILDLVEKINECRSRKGLAPVEFRVGVNSGSMLAGNMGAADRMDYTVVGDAVNLASRLSHAGDPGEVIITSDMRLLPGMGERVEVRPHGTIRLRGKKEAVATYRVVGINDPFQEEMMAENLRILKALEAKAA